MKEKELFKDAKFGDKYVTRDGRVAVLISVENCQFMLEDLTEYSVASDGLAYDDVSESCDIVSKYQEPDVEAECKKKLIKKVKYWFKNIGPFVFPEDEETLDDLVKYLKK